MEVVEHKIVIHTTNIKKNHIYLFIQPTSITFIIIKLIII